MKTATVIYQQHKIQDCGAVTVVTATKKQHKIRINTKSESNVFTHLFGMSAYFLCTLVKN